MLTTWLDRTCTQWVLGVTLLGFSGGCATLPPMSQQEELAATVKTYPNSSDEILAAATDVFFLADGWDFHYHETPSTLTAIRGAWHYAIVYYAHSWDTWTVTTESQGKDTVVRVEVVRKQQYSSTLGQSQEVVHPKGPAVYRLFFHRLDYLLGHTQDWMTCKNIEAWIEEGKTWGEIDWLCGWLANDRRPEELRMDHSQK